MRLENEVQTILNLPNIEQARAVSSALDLYFRLAIGQIEEITELVRIGTIPVGGKQGERVLASLEQIEQVEALANEIKAVLGYSRGGSNGIGNRHIDPSAHRAYEVMKVLDKAIAIQQDPTPKFRGVNYDGLTVRYTKDPAPTVLNVETRRPTAWLVRSKTGLVRTAWTTTPTEEQLAVAECDGDTVTPLFE